MGNCIVNIYRKWFSEENTYFIFAESTQFTSRDEFQEVFTQKIVFFSNTNKQFPKLRDIPATKPAILNRPVNKIETIVEQTMKLPWNIFVVSTRKEESKAIFEALFQKWVHETHTILIENMTWWLGKNIFKAQKNTPCIIIGWYAFLLSCYAAKIPLEEILIFNIKGSSEQQILDDICWYAS
jgi:hypothetical protein